MKIKDVNTTDLLATDRGELARVILTGQLWKFSHSDRSPFPFQPASRHARQGRMGVGYTGLMIGHLALVHWGIPEDEDLTELTNLRLPSVDATMEPEVVLAALKGLQSRLSDTNLRLHVINTQRARLWEDAQEQKRVEHEAYERQYNERVTRKREAVERFDRLAPALSIYTGSPDYHRSQVGYKAYAGDTPVVTVTLSQLEQLLSDAALGREHRQTRRD